MDFVIFNGSFVGNRVEKDDIYKKGSDYCEILTFFATCEDDTVAMFPLPPSLFFAVLTVEKF